MPALGPPAGQVIRLRLLTSDPFMLHPDDDFISKPIPDDFERKIDDILAKT